MLSENKQLEISKYLLQQFLNCGILDVNFLINEIENFKYDGDLFENFQNMEPGIYNVNFAISEIYENAFNEIASLNVKYKKASEKIEFVPFYNFLDSHFSVKYKNEYFEFYTIEEFKQWYDDKFKIID